MATDLALQAGSGGKDSKVVAVHSFNHRSANPASRSFFLELTIGLRCSLPRLRGIIRRTGVDVGVITHPSSLLH